MDDTLLDALASLAADEESCGVVWGTDSRTGRTSCEIARRWPLIGTRRRSRAIKDPLALARLSRTAAFRIRKHRAPARRMSAVGQEARRRLRRQPYPAAGDHDELNDGAMSAARGRRAGLGFVPRDGRRALVLGFSGSGRRPPRDSRFVTAAHATRRKLRATSKTPYPLHRDDCRRRSLVGLNSADFLVHRSTFHLLEINAPRRDASISFEPAEGSLFVLHVAACKGNLPDRAPALDGAAASPWSTPTAISVSARSDWPAWTADRPHAGTLIGASDRSAPLQARARPRRGEAARRSPPDRDPHPCRCEGRMNKPATIPPSA